MPSYIPPKKNTAFIIYIGLPSQANATSFQSNPTLAAGDFKVSIDGGSLTNLTTLPTVTPASGKMVKVSLSTSEMNGDNITLVCSDASGAEWRDIVINIQTSAQQIDDLATQVSVNTVDDFLDTEITDIQARLPAALVSGRIDASVGAMASNVVTAASLATDAGAEIADAVWDEPLTQPASVFAWAGSFRNLLNWLGALSRNKILETNSLSTLRNDADNADLSTSVVSDDGTTFVRNEWT
jgi:hypothetical protein